MKTNMLVSAAVIAALSQLSLAQTPQPAPAAARAGGAVALPGVEAGTLQLRQLPAVLDARERRQDWHEAAQQAAAKIQEPALRDQFNQRLAGLVPTVAKALIAQPQEDALVTVAVYRDASQGGKHAMVAVTFDGLGAGVGQTFFADVIAGLPKPPEAEGIPKSLTLDTEATSYMIFFMGKNQLLAGDIPHTVMGRSVVALSNKEKAAGIGGGTAVVTPTPAPAAPARSQAQQPDLAHPEVGDVQPFNQYGVPQGYQGYAPVNDGYYYPSVGVPIVILPNEYPSTPDYLNTQRQRQMELEKRYQRNANTPGGNRSVTPQSGNNVTPQSGNYVTPQSGNTVTPQSGNGVNTGAGNGVAPGQGNSVTPQPTQRPPVTPPPAGAPGGPPANANAPQQGIKNVPPAGAPGGPPAAAGKK
ncbi:MAG TPA: hypothetical protein VIM11_01395 [Tepidisphaeraceae bacterium]